MATYGPHALVTPEYPTAADGPSAFQQFAASVEKGLYGTALDEADRDTRYADIPPGGLVTCVARKAVWMRMPVGWHTLVSDRVVTTGATAGADWELDRFEAAVEDERQVVLSLRVLRTGGTITAPGNGNIANEVVATIPTGTRPKWSESFNFRATATSGGATVSGVGVINIVDMHPTAQITEGQYLEMTTTYRLGG